MPSFPSRLRATLLAVVLTLPLLIGAAPGDEAAPAPDAADVSSASGFQTWLETESPACTPLLGGVDVTAAPYFTDGDCGWTDARLSGVPDGATVTARMVGPVGDPKDLPVTDNGDATIRVPFTFDDTFPTGDGALQVLVDGEMIGSTPLYHNALQVTFDEIPAGLAPGDDVPVAGVVEQVSLGTGLEAIVIGEEQRDPVPAAFDLQVRSPEGDVVGDPIPVTANAEGAFTATIPDTVTAALSPVADALTVTAAIQAVDATYDDAGTTWYAAAAGSAPLGLGVEPGGLQVDASFVSSTGWVKPGESFPFRVTVTNATGAAVADAAVTMPAPPAVTFTKAPLSRSAARSTLPRTRSPGSCRASRPGAPRPRRRTPWSWRRRPTTSTPIARWSGRTCRSRPSSRPPGSPRARRPTGPR